jgi:hypothetical protein
MASSIPNRGPELLAVDVVFMTSAIVSMALRIYVRMRMVKAFGLDDWLMSLATVGIPPLSPRTAIDHGHRSSSLATPPPRSLEWVTGPADTIAISPSKAFIPRDIAGGSATSSTAAPLSSPRSPSDVSYYASLFASYTRTSSTQPCSSLSQLEALSSLSRFSNATRSPSSGTNRKMVPASTTILSSPLDSCTAALPSSPTSPLRYCRPF